MMDQATRMACVKAALWDLVDSVKQLGGFPPITTPTPTNPTTPRQATPRTSPYTAQIQAVLRQKLAGSPGYVTQPEIPAVRAPGRSMLPGLRAGSGIEPTPRYSDTLVGTTAPTALNWARTENRQQLRDMLGRRPTREERQAGMQVRRQLAKAAGQPFVGINPDNWTPDYYEWHPETMTNPQFRDTLLPYAREGDYANRAELRENLRNMIAGERRSGFEDDPLHPIHPNASLRHPQVGLDPRVPERYNRLLPPGRQMTQDQMDQVRRAYYTRYPDLVPVEGQPGYNQWKNQVLRSK